MEMRVFDFKNVTSQAMQLESVNCIGRNVVLLLGITRGEGYGSSIRHSSFDSDSCYESSGRWYSRPAERVNVKTSMSNLTLNLARSKIQLQHLLELFCRHPLRTRPVVTVVV